MTLATPTPTPTSLTAPPDVPLPRAPVETLVAAACDVVAEVSLDDPCWNVVGPRLTAFVDAARLAVGRSPSPIRPGEPVATVLRLRDLGRLVQATAGTAAIATPEAAARLRSLQIAALR